MAIEFMKMFSDDDWVPLSLDHTSAEHRWHAGGSLADAPVDVRATFTDAMWKRTVHLDEFLMVGYRTRANFVIPRHQHNQRKLIILFQGGCQIDYAGRSEPVSGLGAFFIVDRETPYTMTAGPEGVVYTEQWDLDISDDVETVWYPEGWQ
jgi:hypothetical protein